MPHNFGRFRILNDGGNRKIRNETGLRFFVRPDDEAEPFVIEPGVEMFVPETAEGETIIDIEDVM